ncbi:hypothetical protein Tco_0618091 [Tanacetum coccineum]
MVEDFMEVFMDDFLVFGNSFDCCLANLDRMLARCEETNLVFNWEKCHFMVKEGIVLGHKISGAGIEVDRAKIDVIAKLPYLINVKGVRSFIGHAGFYRSKQDVKPRLVRCVLQGFDIEIKDKKGIYKDAKEYVMRCDACQRLGNISSRSEMRQNNIQEVQHTRTPASTRKEQINGMTLDAEGIKTLKLGIRTVEITDKNEISFKVKGQRLKKYYDGHIDTDDKQDLAGKEIDKVGEGSIIWNPMYML